MARIAGALRLNWFAVAATVASLRSRSPRLCTPERRAVPAAVGWPTLSTMAGRVVMRRGSRSRRITGPASALQQAGDRPRRARGRASLSARRRVIDVEQQNAETREDGLPLPQAQQLFEVLGAVGQAVGGQQGRAQAQRLGGGGGDRQGVGGGAAELHDRQVAARPASAQLSAICSASSRWDGASVSIADARQRIEQARQPFVELADADQEVQHPLVDPQRGAGEDGPAATSISRQRRSGASGDKADQCASVEDGEGEAEGRERARRLALRRGAEPGNSASSSMPAHSSSSSVSNAREAERLAQPVAARIRLLPMGQASLPRVPRGSRALSSPSRRRSSVWSCFAPLDRWRPPYAAPWLQTVTSGPVGAPGGVSGLRAPSISTRTK